MVEPSAGPGSLGNDGETFGNSQGVQSKVVGFSCPSSFLDATIHDYHHVRCGDGDRIGSHFSRLRASRRAVVISTALGSFGLKLLHYSTAVVDGVAASAETVLIMWRMTDCACYKITSITVLAMVAAARCKSRE
jgi:hypothetical protein